MSSKKSNPSQVKKFRSDVAKLKAAGLVSNRIDARSQRETRYMKSQVKKFADVLEGKAKVVTLKRGKKQDYSEYRQEIKTFKEKFKAKGKHFVIPKAFKEEYIYYDQKTKSFIGSHYSDGKRVKRSIYLDPSKEISKNQLFVIPLGNSRQSFDTWSDMVLFMEPYENNPKNPYKEWAKYVEIVTVEDSDSDGDE